MIWDVFIAYHGTFDNKNGSILKAREIYDFLSGENGMNCYFYPETGQGNFGKTTIEASRSRLFLLVANANILNKLENGELAEDDPIYEEIDAFYQNQMRSHLLKKSLLRVYCYDGLSDTQADVLFPVATKNVEHFDETRDGEEIIFTNVLKWAKNICSEEKFVDNHTENDSDDKPEKNEKTDDSSKNKNRDLKIINYLVKQYGWIPLSILTSVAFSFLFLSFSTEKSILRIIVLVLINVVVLLGFFTFSFLKKTFDVGFNKIIRSTIFGEANPQRIMKTSKRRIRFLGIASSKWLKDEELFKQTLMRLCSDDCGGIEFLLLNPKSEYAKRMDLACKKGDMLTSESINSCINNISKCVREICYEKRITHIKGFNIRLYSKYPVFRVVISDDDRIFLSFYNAGTNGDNNFQIKIKEKRGKVLFRSLINYYNQIWNDENSIDYYISI